MKFVRAKSFTAGRAWCALDSAKMNGLPSRQHWTDEPCRRHVNDGEARILVVESEGGT